MEKEWNIIEVLRHSRHDWLNRLQLIKGNLDLNRVDRAKAVIEEIIYESQNEARLSNLPMTDFAALLLKANWEYHTFKLEYEVIQDAATTEINDHLLTTWTKYFFTCLNGAIDPFNENLLSITVDLQDDGSRFFFDFSGIINSRERMEEFLAEPISVDLDLAVRELSESELTIELFMPIYQKGL